MWRLVFKRLRQGRCSTFCKGSVVLKIDCNGSWGHFEMCLTCEGLSTQILWPTLEHFKKTNRWAVKVEPPVADEVGLVEHRAIGTEETVPGCRFCVYFQINCLNVNVNLWMIRRLYIKFSLLLLVAFQKKSGGKKNLTLSNHRCHRWRRCGTVGTRPPGLHNNLWFEK